MLLINSFGFLRGICDSKYKTKLGEGTKRKLFPRMGASSDFYRYEHIYKEEKSKAAKLKLYEKLPAKENEQNLYFAAANFNPKCSKKNFKIVDQNETAFVQTRKNSEKWKKIQTSILSTNES